MKIYSYEVILALLIVVLLSWILPKKIQMLSSSLMTMLFLIYFDSTSLFLLLFMFLSSYYSSQKYTFSTKVLLWILLLVSSILIFYKVSILIDASQYIMPLGVSFYSFRVIHYVFEGYKHKLPEHSMFDYFNYLFFLPTFIVGPINRFQQFHNDLYNRELKRANISWALERILYGYTKIVILGSYLFGIKLLIYMETIQESHSYFYHYLVSIQYWLSLYFQFSGYSDIAIGISALMGFKIMENFNYPFFAKNISEFWQRWHISLSKWIKDYVYLPIVALTRKPFLSVLVSLIIFGLWHELSINYIFWGFYHALGITIWHKFQWIKSKNRYIRKFTDSKIFLIFSIVLTFHFVIFSFEIRTLFLQLFNLN